jgi:PadR family transcriptional regulator, regulatory protein PadR
MVRKRSHQAKLILQAFREAPSDEVYGLQVVRASGVPAGTAYAILRRFEDEGLLDGRWEQISPEDEGRPPRYYYRLNGAGERVAREETANDEKALRLLVPGWSAS